MIEIIDFFNKQVCKEIASDVKRLKANWTNHGAVQTLGGAIYAFPWSLYARTKNDTLRPEFQSLHGKLKRHFKGYYSSELARPGFHVFDSRHSGMSGDIHLDEPFKMHPMLAEKMFTGRPITYTIPVELPLRGSGLNVWSKDGMVKFIQYEVGKMYFHNGLFPHQIAETFISPGEFRMTIQGHGIVDDDGTTLLYF